MMVVRRVKESKDHLAFQSGNEVELLRQSLFFFFSLLYGTTVGQVSSGRITIFAPQSA